MTVLRISTTTLFSYPFSWESIFIMLPPLILIFCLLNCFPKSCFQRFSSDLVFDSSRRRVFFFLRRTEISLMIGNILAQWSEISFDGRKYLWWSEISKTLNFFKIVGKLMVGNIPRFLKCALSANLLNKDGREDANAKISNVLCHVCLAKVYC